ncbi:DNA polymerase II large subunit [Haloplanus rubicundus]|uniref:DNA polymerase II large subunit n=1 Tax=Haloplanus rubicundus TaxID=1547898 RepID=A0A345E9R7_9EURY|nr:DNA polymerase II large subunit [Haloplanus rubicundus]AXG08939.1 DNA polymerase II large subunit [Haloplanus rubicundus]
MTPDDERYFERMEARLDEAFDRAERARSRGADPTTEVEIPVARDMADRVENILGIDGVAERVRELDGQMSREEAALALVTDFVEGTVGDYDTNAGKIEGAVRTAVALLTEGVVAAPIEGIDRVEVLANDDGTEFVNVYYAGPIRSAGGTAQALSVLVADYARSLLGIDEFKPRDDEVERYAEEVGLYDSETGLQYTPKDKETKFIAEHMPIMLDGEATGDEEVSGFRDLERVDTNSARGGMCLVLAEGIALKAPKIQRYTRDLAEVEWPWLQDLIDGTIGKDDGEETDETAADEGDDADDDAAADDDAEPSGPPRVDPSTKFLRDLIAGRPVFGHPSEAGGFRLRYGRARNHGFATAGVHPATMHLVDDFLATGTQIKTERPGKAAGVVPVDTIEGPTVRLANGEVRRIDDPAEALAVRNGVEEILDLGEYLVNYGEFVENNHPLAPASYTVEWWVKEFEESDADVQALRDDPRVDLEDPSADEALRWATEFDCPLHPAYTYLWHDVSVAAMDELAAAVAGGETVAVEGDGGVGRVASDGDESTADTLLVEATPAVRRTLETLLVEHVATDGVVRIADWRPFARSLGVTADLDREWTLDDLSTAAREYDDGDNAVRAVDEVAPFTVRERAPTRIGNRMGRPEKSEGRDLSPAVHTLYPIGEAGGSQRDVGGAARARTDDGRGVVNVQVGRRACPDCGATTHRTQCRNCGAHTEPVYECESCEQVIEPDESGRVHCDRCDRDVTSVEWRRLDLGERYQEALDTVGEREAAFEILKGVKGLTSANKTPEPMEKGVLRAKHGVSSFKDGTVRYDMTDLPVTAVRPEELDVTAEDFRELGYETDVDGDPLRFDDQLVELKVQDIVLSDGAAEHLLKTADFVDDLLTEFYDLPPFYEVAERQDLVGELVFGMAPHTSAAVVGRVVGFTSAAVGYAHPYFHAAKRRNCFHPETKVWYRDEDGAWHHERIERLVEERLEDPETDDFGTLVQELDGDVHVPSIDDDGEQVLKPVEAVSKHRAPDHLVEIETRSGRAVTVTPDHEVQVFDGGEVESKRASKVADDDQLIKPSHLDTVSPADEPQRIDLLAELLRRDIINGDRLTIRGIAKSELYDLFTESLRHRWEGTFYPLKSTAEYLGLSKKALSNYVYRESIPVQLLDRLFESTDALLSAVPDDVKLGVKRDRAQMDRFVELNGRVATLLGYYAAEGFARAQETPKGTIHQTTVCGTESEAREFFMETFRSEFGVEPYRENEAKVTVSGRLPRAFFDTILNAGVYAESKRVPQHIFDSSNRIAAAYLRGYFSGDGSVDSTGTTVSASTVSNELKEDIVALLTRFGIEARIRHVEPVLLQDQFPEHYRDNDMSMSKPAYVVHLAGERSVRFSEQIGFHLSRKDEVLRQNVAERSSKEKYARCFDGGNDEYLIDTVESTSISTSNVDSVYCLTVADTHTLITNDLSNCQCDGDEDCVMLLMDGLLNFSQEFLPDQRGGRMDAPLVMSSRIDPTEIDDEAHNMDVVREYPLEFYEATREMADPEAVDVEIAEDSLDTEAEYHGFDHTHDTSNIALGPDLSAYKTLGSMMDKMDAQLNLARKLRAVDETDVAERVIEYHFLPDLIGNLRAFSRQETRCLDCGESYRRMPLSGDCRECGGRVNLTVHEGSVNKYMDTAIQVAEEFGCRPYTKQRLEVLEKSLESVFQNDHNKPSRLDDFM